MIFETEGLNSVTGSVGFVVAGMRTQLATKTMRRTNLKNPV
jgi:hypothetical protein